jgi:hypothetical protein
LLARSTGIERDAASAIKVAALGVVAGASVPLFCKIIQPARLASEAGSERDEALFVGLGVVYISAYQCQESAKITYSEMRNTRP